ncbi:tetratricopeptide repeat protein [Streptomyces cyaneochromogenes]|uniref:Tetratricopeptide repeat protein n=1 Tax=Streptomyces cyaneochromogenes TaxID=2496836 RepID=A0A3S9LYV6_9ACTN|nr:tetratricopeptide repeat protein [Streptomyces cyaneochromogenes]AZQ32107.1 tetratricopeptide repeat protein [Streptomyces cyaneochromogenes]AZQ40116.1 tetratricopeptide repeat protein [Streptomyces cyaneochromogenes]
MVAQHGAVAAGRLEVGQMVVAAAAGRAQALTLAAPLGYRNPALPLRGRDELLNCLLDQCRRGGDGRLHVLHGLSGSGKTALALEIVHMLQMRASPMSEHRVWWLDARQAALFEDGFRAVARRIGVAGDLLEADGVVDALWHRLSRAELPWLLVIDGVDDPRLLDGPGLLAAGTGWIRPHSCPCGLVLVTTCDGTADAWGSGAVMHPVLPLKGRDAACVLMDHAGPDAGALDDAACLARRLGGLPLALRMAGVYLAEVMGMPDAFREPETPAEFDAFRRALDGPAGQGLNPAQVIADTWRLALDLLHRRGFRYAADVLELLSVFADAPVPHALVLRAQVLQRHPGFEGIDGGTLWRTLRALAALSLIDLCPAPEGDDGDESEESARSPECLRVHPLIRDVSRTPRYLSLVTGLLQDACSVEQVGKPEEPSSWAAWSVLAPHALELVEQEDDLASLPDAGQVSAAAAAEMAARFLQARGLSRRAGAVFRKVVRIRMRVLGAAHPETLTAQHNLAGALHDVGELGQAETVYRKVWQAHRDARGAEFAHALTARHELGRVLHDLGRLEEAQQHLSAVLDVRRRLLGEQHGHTLSAQHELARVLHDLGLLREACREYGLVLAARCEQLGDEHPRTLTTLHNLACLMQDEGELTGAQQQFERVHAVRSRVLGEVHPQTLWTGYRLGCVLRDRGDTVRARALLLHVRDGLSAVLGEGHVQTERAARALEGLAGPGTSDGVTIACR